jgi:rhodanese-related sulfurtransferase
MNIDISSPDFASQIDELDHAANYVIYCHSGNRAGQAISYMQSAGFSGNLVNAGGVDSASQLTGLKITN